MTTTSEFVAAVEDPTNGVAAELTGDAVLITFGGISGGLQMPPFEFLRLTEGMGLSRILVRDHAQAWYHHGANGLGGSMEEVLASLGRMLEQVSASKVVTMGSSAGGYAAIWFGAKLGATQIHAFSPQTFLTRGLRIRHLDYRWHRQIHAMRRLAEQTDLDLLPFLREHPQRVTVHYAADSRLDRTHAMHLRELPTVDLCRYEVGGHSLVRDLRDTGKLEHIIRASFGDS